MVIVIQAAMPDDDEPTCGPQCVLQKMENTWIACRDTVLHYFSGQQADIDESEATRQDRYMHAPSEYTPLPAVDTISHAELLEMVEKLNAQIFQLAAQLSRVAERREDGEVDEGTVRGSLEGPLGQAMVTRLLRPPRNGALWVQIGLQAIAVQFAAQHIDGWGRLLADGEV